MLMRRTHQVVPSPSTAHAGCLACAGVLIALWGLGGCGATKSYVATEQLLLSDAVDSSVEQLDFSPLAGHRVYLDRDNIPTLRGSAGGGLVAWEYVVSSVRERMVMSGCQLTPDRESAEIVAEVRLGAMGTDGHSFVVGIPATNNSPVNQVTGQALIPALPELSIAKRDTMSGAAKIAVCAYLRETREAVWQSGLVHANSQSSDTWFMGAGPLQRGSIHEHDDPSEPADEPARNEASVVADQAKHRTPRTASQKASSGPSVR
jgi:hypothetical protein